MPKAANVKDYIRTIVDFPHEGIMFRDVTTLFADPRGFRMAIDQMLHPYAGTRIDKVVGLEARGFILGGAIAHQLSVGFVPIRKKGKLPGTTISQDYKLEYGEAIVEIHDDAIQPGEQILVVDDLLATGGTAEAGIKLIERLGRGDHQLFIYHRSARAWRPAKSLKPWAWTFPCCVSSKAFKTSSSDAWGHLPPTPPARRLPLGYLGQDERRRLGQHGTGVHNAVGDPERI